MLNIVIPVFLGLRETRRCLDSVLAARCEEPFEVVVVNDATPDGEIAAYLRALESAGRIRLIVHAENGGFVVSVNDGMRACPTGDVVLLNSDTEVADGWLDRIAACARRETGVGTVTPFSNNATILSYPRANVANAMPAGASTAELDRVFARENSGASVEIPTAVGFCMLITRACLEAVGPFDEIAFGLGYGEEVDFCMRATRAGFRHLLCADAFVHHTGEVSFKDSGAGRRLAAQALVDERYPEFQQSLRGFLDREPTRPLRRSVDRARLRESVRPRILFVSHHWGGGVQKHVEALASLVADECEVLLLQPVGRNALTLRWLRAGEEFQAWFDPERDDTTLAEFLGELGVSRVHFHHVHGLPRSVLELPSLLGAPHDVTLHDYFAYCPQYHLADPTGRYCGEPDEDGCRRCLDGRPPQWPMDIREWRAAFDNLLRSAERVIAPSQDLAERMRRRFPGLALQEWPHFESSSPTTTPVYKIALLGGISPVKGLDALEACVRDARVRQLPLHFHVIGHVGRVLPAWPDAPLTIGGSYPDGRLDELISLERVDAILFISQVPESYSYTLSAAVSSGLPIIASDLGALPERLRGHAAATLVPWNAPASQINDAILARVRPAAALAVAGGAAR